jgi:hypothetical protein
MSATLGSVVSNIKHLAKGNQMNAELTELFESIIEDAGYAIGYWADEATHNTEAQTYAITIQEEYADEYESKTLTYGDLLEATKKLASGAVKVNSQTKAVCQAIVSDPSDVDYDADDADVIVQVAMFGEIVFG